MAVVNMRELSRRTSRVVDEVRSRKRPTLVTRGGRPVAALVPVDPTALEDWVLATAPEFVAGMRAADRELRGGRTASLDTVLGRPRSAGTRKGAVRGRRR
jgi:prevent-host-death family protein